MPILCVPQPGEMTQIVGHQAPCIKIQHKQILQYDGFGVVSVNVDLIVTGIGDVTFH